MDGDLLLIFTFIVVTAIIVFGSVHAIHKRMIAHEERKLELKARQAEAVAGKSGGPDRALEERVRVLERLATDKGVSLADEIESLRAESPALADHRAGETRQSQQREIQR